VSPRTVFRQYGRTNSSLTVGVTQPACLHLDGANSLEPRTSSKKATNGLSCNYFYLLVFNVFRNIRMAAANAADLIAELTQCPVCQMACVDPRALPCQHTRCSKKTDTQFYFWDNFGNSAPILTILLLLQAEIYGA